MQLHLKKPIAFFDIESTGVVVGLDRIIEISILKLNPDGSQVSKTKRVNPEIPIPAEVSKIHGIFDEDVKNEPTFKQIASSLNQFLLNTDLAGYNSNKFDIPMLVDEFLRVGIDFDIKGRRFVDVQNIFHKMEQRTLVAAYKFYCEKDLINAHSAEADVTATYEVLLAQLDRYPDMKNDIDFLHEFSNSSRNVDLAGRMIFNEDKEPVFNFGKYKGHKVADVFAKDPSYYDWMLKGDFSRQTKHVLTALRLKDFNKA